MDKRDFIAISGYKHLIYVITEKKQKLFIMETIAMMIL